MKVIKKQKNSKNCVLCGLDNPHGIKANFYEMENGELVTSFSYQFEHQSYPGRTHGGLIACVLDESIGRAIWITDPTVLGVTCELNVKYRKPMPYNAPLYCISRITENRSRIFVGEGEIVDAQGVVYAEAHGTFVKLSNDKIGDFDIDEEMCYDIADEVTDIDIEGKLL